MQPSLSRIRILFVVRSLHVGGMEQMVIELAGALDPAKYEIQFCTIEDPGQLADQVAARGIELTALNKPPGLRPGYIAKLRTILNEWQPDIIHTHNDTGHFYAALANAARLKRCKLIHTKHGRGDIDDRKAITRNWLSSYLSDLVIAVSDDVASVCRDIEHVRSKKVRTIINGIKLEPYLNLKRDTHGETSITFGHVGRLSAVKNQRLQLTAFAEVLRKVPEARLEIAGDGPLRAELQATSQELNLGSSVTFLGYRSDIADVLRDVDVFLLSSVSEGTPLVVIEAMAAGLPIIATNVGGLPDMISDCRTGYLVASGDVDGMTKRMLDLACNQDQRFTFGERGREVAKSRYSLDRMVNDYEAAYQSLIQRDAT